MFNRIVCSAVMTITMAGASQSQTPSELPPESRFYLQPGDVTELSGLISRASDATNAPSDDGRPTKALLTLISAWLAQNFDLPTIADQPRVNLVDPMTMAKLRRGGADAEARTMAPAFNPSRPLDRNPNRNEDSVAIYDDDARTIYLSNGWTSRTPRDVSVLVHEMVHHVQNMNGQKFECLEAREKAAYAAQERWLGMFGLNLEDELHIDPFTVLVKGMCKY